MTQEATIQFEDENGEVTVASTRKAVTTAIAYHLAAETDDEAVLTSVGRRADKLLTAWVVDRIGDMVCHEVLLNSGDERLAEKVEWILHEAWLGGDHRPNPYFWHYDYKLSDGEYRILSSEKMMRERHAKPFASFGGETALIDFVLAYDANDETYTDEVEKIATRMELEAAAREERRLRRFVKFGNEEGWRRDLLDVVPSLTIGVAP